MKLANETRRLSMEASRRQSTTPESNGSGSAGGINRRTSTTPENNGNYGMANGHGPTQPRRASKTPPSIFSRKTSESLGFATPPRRGSTNGSSGTHHVPVDRKPSSELDATELQHRRQSEAGLRRPSATDVVLNNDTSRLMVGMPVWVDGTKHGRIAFIGEVHFAKGEMAGIHLEAPVGKNNGSVGGVMYFQCEPKRGVFSRLHRLTLEPMVNEEEGY